MKLLITGGCGFVGSNLAYNALINKHEVMVLDNLQRKGSDKNLDWLRENGLKAFENCDIRNAVELTKLISKFRPDCIFHLAGQVAMTTSLMDPYYDFTTNVTGTINVLEAIRKHSPNSGLIFSSTNKVYGDLEQFHYSDGITRWHCDERPNGFAENTPLSFHSPYGCSKGAADQYICDYARSYGLKVAVLRHSSMYGGRQFATYDQGWVGWFCQQALLVATNRIEEVNISGSGKQVRDLLHSDDVVQLYFSVVEKLEEGNPIILNIGGGVKNSMSLIELIKHLEESLSISININKGPERQGDQKVFVADITKANELLQWEPRVGYQTGLDQMLDWTQKIVFSNISR